MKTEHFRYDDDFGYEEYEALFDPLRSDRQARRKRRPQVRHLPKKREQDVQAGLADQMAELEGGFEITYRPSRFEETWLLQSLRPFYEQSLITDVLAQVKSGKEANVYRCAAHPSLGAEFVAAKVYRPRVVRAMRNDKVYREGRAILDANGHDVSGGLHRDRVIRAIGKKTEFGVQTEQTSWLMHEFTALQTLHAAGAAVPQPIQAAENAILMSYHGDDGMAAPTLHEIDLEPDETGPLFREVLRNVELMLHHGMIHGDLSAYNILYWEGAITLIDFPQVTNCHTNSSARAILGRDVERVCSYFARYGMESDPEAITRHLWRRYAAKRPEIMAADLSRLFPEDGGDSFEAVAGS